MHTFRNTLLDWPHQAPSSAIHSLVDVDFIQSLEQGPPSWWQDWQHQRLTALLAWLGQSSFASLPVQSRTDFNNQANTPRLPPEHGHVTQYQSSGSSGVPVTFGRSELATRISWGHYMADHKRQGRDLYAILATLTGTPGAHEGSHLTLAGDPWIHPGEQLARNAPQFSMLAHAQWVCEYAPKYLATTPATLSSILSIVDMNRLKAPRITQIMTSSHMVEPELRERTRRVFGASIRDRYSCEEIGPLAFQCPESDDYYHVAVGNAIIEVVDANGRATPDGELGNVLVTGLHQWATPALRYDLGDVARLHPSCPACGATVPTLSELLGRKYFLLHSTQGGLRHVRILAEHWLACAPVREHRVVQIASDRFHVEVVLDRPLDSTEMRALQTMLGQALGPEFAIDIVQLDAIVWPPGRKRQEFVGFVP